MSTDRTAVELWDRMPGDSRGLCQRAAETADRLGYAVYLVGGSVRDLLLGGSRVDIDLVVEGDAPAVARAVGHELGAPVHGPSQFMTASVTLPGGRHMDLATARQETYPQPAKLPVVRPSTIQHDLVRRDISINAIALRLTASGAGELVDPHRGRQDLSARIIRVLHERSFADDPTRILRVARFRERLGFAVEPQTLCRLEVAVREGALGQVTGSRIREEIVKLLGEPRPAAVIDYLQDLGALGQVLPGVRATDSDTARMASTPVALAAVSAGPKGRSGRTWTYCLGALCASGDAPAVADRLDLDGEARSVLERMAEAIAGNLPWAIGARTRVSGVVLDAALADEPRARLVGHWLRSGPEGRRRIEWYAQALRPLRADIDGHDLQQHGMQPGPAIAVGLAAARRAKIGGETGRAEQLQAAVDAVREWQRPRRRDPRDTGRQGTGAWTG